MPIVRHEYHDDCEKIREVNKLAFGQASEADLVDALREAGKVVLSLVAEENRTVVGHILFSPAGIEGTEAKLAALGPMAVLPSLQRHGIGTMLVQEGMGFCRTMGYEAVVVVGAPRYYARFGFKPASEFGLAPQWKDAPPEAFMALELEPGALQAVEGIVRYVEEFEAVCNRGNPCADARG